MDRKYASRLSGEGQVVPSEQRPAQHSSSARVQLLPPLFRAFQRAARAMLRRVCAQSKF